MSEVQMAVSSSEPPAESRTIELNLRPRPVSVTVPTMMPAPAQVAATFSTPSEPPASAFTSPELHRPRATGTFLLKTSYGMSAVSGLRKLVSAETSVAQNTAITGEKPHSMNTTRSEEHTSELQSQSNLVCRLLLEKKKKKKQSNRASTAHIH